MCGISGFIEKKPGSNGTTVVQKMGQLCAHRGPNAEGCFSEAPLHFHHRRLSILDLDPKADQPMYNQDCVLLFNGEIYNYLALRAELSDYPFKTKGDAEVILAAWQRWGINCANHLHGMWSFSLYDRHKQLVFCSRDRFGIKPFYYYETNAYFAFASEIKQFTCLPGWNATANINRLQDFLLLELLDHTDETMFLGVRQLLPGHNLLLSLATKKHTIACYYDSGKDLPLLSKLTYLEATTLFRQLMQTSVQEHLQADVAVGSCLSGGLDSSSLVGLIHHLQSGDTLFRQATVSACYTDPQIDEQEYIDDMVFSLGLEGHKTFPNITDFWADLKKIVWHQDEPFPTTSIYAQWAVFAKAKKQGLSVMLDGQGADELLAGYGGIYAVFLAEFLRKAQFLRFGKELYGLQKTQGLPVFALLAASFAELLPRRLKAFCRFHSTRGLHGFVSKQQNYYQNCLLPLYANKMNTMQKYSRWLLTKTSLPKLLHFEDRNSMAFSVEARVPFLDDRVVEAAISMPSSYKLTGGVTKRVLRDSMANLLTPKIYNRQNKLGFETPETIWIRKNTTDFRRYYLASLKRLGGLVNETHGVAWFEKQLASPGNIDHGVWRIISAGLWAEEFSVNISGGVQLNTMGKTARS